MAHLARLSFIITDPTTGLPINGATVEVRKQGATVNGTTGPTTINVHAQGAINTGDTVNIDNDADIPVAVLTQPSAVQMTVAAAGFATLINDVTRITVTTPKQLIWNATERAEMKTNPLTTDALGEAFCYVENGLYDALVTVGGVKTLLVDQVAAGGQSSISNAFVTGEKGFEWDTLRALSSVNSYEWSVDSVLKMSISASGGTLTTPGNLVATGVGSFAAALTLAADLIMSATASQLVPGATSFAIRNNADTADNLLVLDIGDVTVLRDLAVTRDLDVTRDVDQRRVHATKGTALVIGDISLGAGWGDTATVTSIVGNDTRGEFRVQCNGSGITVNPTLTLTFKDGTYTAAPFVVANSSNNNTVLTSGDFWYTVATATSLSFIYGGTPVATRIYTVNYHVIK